MRRVRGRTHLRTFTEEARQRKRRIEMMGQVRMGILSIAAAAIALAGDTPKTAWGHPDLQGIWDFATITPLERPADLAGKKVLTDEEAAAFEKKTLETRNQDRRDGGAQADVARAYNEVWWDYGKKVVGTRQTSLVVDPPDGRIPAITPDGQKRAAERAVIRNRLP